MMNPLEAVILDMDGLMLDTERVSKQAWQEAAAELGYELSDIVYLRCLGRPARDHGPIMRAALGHDFPFQLVRARRTEIVESHLSLHGVPLKPGLLKFLARIASYDIPLCVATSTARDTAMKRLSSTNLLPFFKAIVTGDEVVHAKPSPDIYLLAAHKLGVDPSLCLAVEDSQAGFQAARSAGMPVVIIPDLQEPSPELREHAAFTTSSLDDAIDFVIKSCYREVGAFKSPRRSLSDRSLSKVRRM
jgi:HAD superfamily hydrolase (TIGR01509 family)